MHHTERCTTQQREPHPGGPGIVRDLGDGHSVVVEVADALRKVFMHARLQLVCDVAPGDGPQRQNVGLRRAAEPEVDVAQRKCVELRDVAVRIPACTRVLSAAAGREAGTTPSC